MTIQELREMSGAGLHECKKAMEYCKTHADCTPLGYLMACGVAVATPNLTFDERVKKFSKKGGTGMTKSQERKLNNAIFQLKRYYETAIGNGHIKHPLAWALYQTWKEEDTKARITKGKKWKVTYYCTDCVKMNTDGCPYHTRGVKDKACEDFLGANGEEIEIWNSTHGQTMAPKGTFEKIFNDQDTESDFI